MERTTVVLVFVLWWCASVHADDGNAIYEELTDLRIGRVFLSPAERAFLDHQRKNPSTVSAPVAGTTPQQTEVRKSRDTSPAGYIVGGSGRHQQWSNGTFVESGHPRSISSMSFPGDIKVIRHVASDTAEISSDEPEKGDLDPVGASPLDAPVSGND